MNQIFKIAIIIGLLLMVDSIWAQNTMLDIEVTAHLREGTVQELLDDIEAHNDVVFSFDPNKISVRRKVHLSRVHYSLGSILNQFFVGQNVQYRMLKNKILILPSVIKYIRLSGFIKSIDDQELLTGAILYDNREERSSFANDAGYYSIKLAVGQVDLSIYYLGNIKENVKVLLTRDTTINFYLRSDYNLDSVMIIDKYDPFVNVHTSAEKVIDYIRQTFKGKLGQNDVYENVRMMSGVQSGNEAQGGLYVRGGTPDQNLILFEGTPMYETSHLGGLSSVFWTI